MNWQNNIYAWPLFLSAIVCAYAGWRAWRRRKVYGATPLALLLTFVTAWALAYACELSVSDFPTQMLMNRLEYIGITGVPICWWIFVMQYTRQDKWLKPAILGGVIVFAVLIQALVWTNEWHMLMWKGFQQQTVNGQVLFITLKGWGFYGLVSYTYTLLVWGTVFLLRTLKGATRLYRQQTIIMLLGSFAPWVANVMFITGLTPFGALDLTPFSFTITGLTISWGLFRYSLLDVVPVAREAVLDGITDGVIMLDVNQRVLMINPAAVRLLALETNNIEGTPFEKLPGLPPEALTGENKAELEVKLTSANGDQFVEVHITPFHDRLGQPIGQLVVLHDVTTRKQYEIELQQARYAAENAREIAEQAHRSRSRSLAKMSRNLRTPLSVITGYTESVKEDLQGMGLAPLIQRLDRVIQSGQQLARAISDIQDISELETRQIVLNPQIFTVSTLASKLENDARPLVKANNNRMRVLYPLGDPGEIYADQDRLYQILLSLLENAAKYTRNGNILFSIQYEPDTPSARLQFEINDTGTGMAPQQVATLFQPFHQLDNSTTRSFSGSGLGLAISKQLVELMGGEIKVRSSPNAGSIFTVLLPVKPPLKS